MSRWLETVSAPDEATEKLLLAHPHVASVQPDDSGSLRFASEHWNREIRIGAFAEGPSGLMELIDNNPVVCADHVGIPCASGTLALIALGPIVQAGILVEAPTMLTNAPNTAISVEADLLSVGWSGGLTFESQDVDLSGVFAATIIAAINVPEELDEIDELYEERYSRSFFVRRDDESVWDAELVRGHPEAIYRLRITPDAPVALLTIQVMADRDGKCGACQFVHAMNIMCGFEESLGIPNRL